MVSQKPDKALNFALFLLPAFLLYLAFFIGPLVRGVQYSFTDWNGIVPEIPFTMDKEDFEGRILNQLRHPEKLQYILAYYRLNDDGDTYQLAHWVKGEDGKDRPLSNAERRRIKRILKSVGITSVKFIGLQNFREMFKEDMRFMPRIEKQFLFNEFDDLPASIDAKAFHRYLWVHIKDDDERSMVQESYLPDNRRKSYRLQSDLSTEQDDALRRIISQNMFKEVFIPGVVGFTLFFTLFNVLFSNLFAIVLALILDTRLKSKNILRSIFFLPNVLSLVIVAFIWSFVFRLILPALTGIPVWLGSPDVAPWAVVMVSVWQGCGYLMIIYLAGLQTVPAEIMEAAEVDGATYLQRLFHVKFPLLLPALTICLFYSLANSLKTFDIIFALTNGGPGYATTPVVLDIYFNAFLQNRFGYGTAKAVFLCLIIIIVTGTQLFFMKRREVEL